MPCWSPPRMSKPSIEALYVEPNEPARLTDGIPGVGRQHVDHLSIVDVLVAVPGEAADLAEPVQRQGCVAAEGSPIDDRTLDDAAVGAHATGTHAL